MKINKIYEKIIEFIKDNIWQFVIIGLTLFACFYKIPYVVYRPGGAVDLTERIVIDNDNIVAGSYNMSYVTVMKGNIVSALTSFIIRDWDLVKMEKVTYEDMDYDTTLKLDKIDYQTSINIATVLAYKKADAKIDISKEEVTVMAVDDDAQTDIKFLDKIISVDGKKYNKLSEVKEYINSLNIGDKIKIEVIDENEKSQDRYAYIYENDGTKVMGVALYVDYEFETDPEVEIKVKSSEAGSSGGLMLTLAIYDCLTKNDLSHGLKIMGTGTIDADGNVGEIGGVKYKLLGAKKNNADVFFVPKDNYEEAQKVYKKYKMKFDLVKVETFDDAVEYLNSI